MKKRLFLLGCSLIASIGFSQIPTNGLVAHYPFNGNANDESGNGNNGTVNGVTLTEDRFGNINSAYSFEIGNRITSSPTLPTGSSARTVSVWFQTTSLSYNPNTGLNANCIVTYGKKVDGTGAFSQCNFETHKGYLRMNNFGGGIGGNLFVSDGNWHHALYTFDGDSTHNLYVDNTLIESKKYVINTGVTDLMFGGRASEPTWHNYEGKLDDIKIYDRVLTECEINALYNEKSNTKIVNVTKEDTLNIYLSQIITTVYTPSSAATTVKVYPNPTSKNLTVEIDNPNNLSGVTIKVMDAQSSVVHNEFVTGSTQSIDVSNWSSGIYFLHIINGNTTVDVRKIVVNN